MRADMFKTLAEELIKISFKTLDQRAKLYADSRDRFENFKSQAALRRVDPMDALLGNASKHTVTFYRILQERSIDIDHVVETLRDEINYRLLAFGLWVEDQELLLDDVIEHLHSFDKAD